VGAVRNDLTTADREPFFFDFCCLAIFACPDKIVGPIGRLRSVSSFVQRSYGWLLAPSFLAMFSLFVVFFSQAFLISFFLVLFRNPSLVVSFFFVLRTGAYVQPSFRYLVLLTLWSKFGLFGRFKPFSQVLVLPEGHLGLRLFIFPSGFVFVILGCFPSHFTPLLAGMAPLEC